MKIRLSEVFVNLIILLTMILLIASYYLGKEQTRYILFLIMGLSFCLYVFEVSRKSQVSILLLIIIMSTFLHSGVIRGEFNMFFLFISSLMYLQYVYRNGLTRSNITLLLLGGVLVTFVQIIGAFRPTSYAHGSSWLMLAYDNPNMAGIILSTLAMVLYSGYYYVETRAKRYALLVSFIALVYMTWLTSNRASIVATGLLILLSIIYRSKTRIPTSLRISFVWFPVIVIIAYRALYLVIPSTAQFLGKPFFSGRQNIWIEIIDSIVRDPSLTYTLVPGGLNMFIYSTIQYGFLTAILYLVLVSRIRPTTPIAKYQKIAHIAFLCLFIQQGLESTLVSGSFAVYILGYSLIGMASSQISIRHRNALMFSYKAR